MKNKKDKENKEPSKRTVGRPPFVPTDEDRAVVKLLVACGMSQDRVCLRIRGNDGKPICEATLKRHFAQIAGWEGRGRGDRAYAVHGSYQAWRALGNL